VGAAIGEAMITIFLHVPRTGGTTLTELIVQKENVWKVSESVVSLLGTVRGTTVWGFDVMAGHVGWGVHKLLPGKEPYQYVSMLRDPVERVASIYYFYRSRDEWSETNLKWKWMAESTSLRTFARAPYAELENAQVRQIAGMQMTGECHKNVVTQEDLDLVIDHLSKFGWVGQCFFLTGPSGSGTYLPLPAFQAPYFVWRDQRLAVQGGLRLRLVVQHLAGQICG